MLPITSKHFVRQLSLTFHSLLTYFSDPTEYDVDKRLNQHLGRLQRVDQLEPDEPALRQHDQKGGNGFGQNENPPERHATGNARCYWFIGHF